MEVIDTPVTDASAVVAAIGAGAEIIELKDGEAFLAAATGTDKDGHKIQVRVVVLATLWQVAKTSHNLRRLSLYISDLDGRRRGPTGLRAPEQQPADGGRRGAGQARRAEGRGHHRERARRPVYHRGHHDGQLERHHPDQPRPDLHQDHRHRELQRPPARDAEGHPQRHPQQRRRLRGLRRHRAQRRDGGHHDDDGRAAAAHTAAAATAADRGGAAHLAGGEAAPAPAHHRRSRTAQGRGQGGRGRGEGGDGADLPADHGVGVRGRQ